MLVALSLLVIAQVATSPAFALDLNSFRAEHKLPPLSYSATLAGAAHSHAQDMAKRNSLDHDGFKERAKLSRGAAAENVLYMTCPRPDAKPSPTGRACGCDEACAIQQWAESPGHRANMLLENVSSYGLASAVSESGRKYWVMMLGN